VGVGEQPTGWTRARQNEKGGPRVSPGEIHLALAAIASARAYYRRHLRFTNAGGKCGLGGPS
jgi:hypothetical protein